MKIHYHYIHHPTVLIMCMFFVMMIGQTSLWAQRATASMINSESDSMGTVEFLQTDSGVVINLDLRNLPQGIYALHIHENGKCERPDFKSAGDHFNPTNTKHGFLHLQGPHAGDLPNFEVGPTGRVKKVIRTNRITLKKNNRNSLLRKGATSIVIHAGQDDYISQPSGASGPRIACGVIRESSE